MLGEELQVFLAIGQNIAANALQESLGESHIVVKLEKRNLGFHHPEFGKVPRGVRILGAKGWADSGEIGVVASAACDN